MRLRINTERLTLRAMTASDAVSVNRLSQDERIYTMVGHLPPNLPLKSTQNWIASHAQGRENQTDFVYAVVTDARIIGCIGLHRSSAQTPFALGYWLDPEEWGHGLITEAASAVITELETVHGPQLIKAGAFVDNPASIRVLAKLGFSAVGQSQEHCAGRGREVEHVNMQRPMTDHVADYYASAN